MRRLAFLATQHREAAMELAEAAASRARAAGFCVTFVNVDEPLEEVEMLVTFGGDGTLLGAARSAHAADVPLLGINTGRLGFLTELDADEALAGLDGVFAGAYSIDTRIALEACVNDGDERLFALNDVVVRRGSSARMAPFDLGLDGATIAHITCDGIVVATPTGSTAYFLSAGGPIISPGVDALGIGALLPHTLFARPLIVPSVATIVVTCDEETVHATVETDGRAVGDLNAHDRVWIRRAQRPARFIRAQAPAFFARLQQKLQWGVPIKRDVR